MQKGFRVRVRIRVSLDGLQLGLGFVGLGLGIVLVGLELGLVVHKGFRFSSFSLFLLLLPVVLVSYTRNHCQYQCQKAFPLCGPLGVS